MEIENITTKDEFLYCDCSAAIENMLIQATALKIGSVWCAIAPNEQQIEGFKKLFQLEDAHLPIAIIALGRPAEKREKIDRYNASNIRYVK